MITNTSIKATTVAVLLGALSIAIAACSETNDSESAEVVSEVTQVKEMTAVEQRVQFRKQSEGDDYQWGKDHIFVKVASAETGGTLALIQDNMQPGFDLGMHLHRTHTEIFYILEGAIDFTMGETPYKAEAGSVVYTPYGTPHAAESSVGGKMLMFYAPGGFDEFLFEIENSPWYQRINPIASSRRNKKYDIYKLSSGKEFYGNGPEPLTVDAGKGDFSEQPTGTRTVKLSSELTDGLANLFEETLLPDALRPGRSEGEHAEIIYVLEGDVVFDYDGEPTLATTGATLLLSAWRGDDAQFSWRRKNTGI